MKDSALLNRLSLLILPFLFTGCYTQFQTYDRYPLEDDRYAGYYAWDGFEQTRGEESSAHYNQGDEEYLDEQMALEEDEIFYKDYETEQWYKKNYADKLYWTGYNDGFEDGFEKGYTDAVDDYYFYGYKPWAYSSWYRTHYTPFYRGYHHSFWVGFGSYGHGYYSYPYYGWGGYYDYGYWGWHHQYSTSVFVYNDYHRSKKYRRNADLYRKGPRGSGIYGSAGDYRTRSGSGIDSRSRGSGVTRSRGINTGSRVRTTSTGRGSSVGKSTGSRSRGSSVGKSSSSSGKSRSRGNGSSVGRGNGSSKSSGSGKSGKSRSRSGNNDSALSTTSVRNINIPDVSNRTYTIPARRVNNTFSRSSSFSINDFFKRSSSRSSLNSNRSILDRMESFSKQSSTISRRNNSSSNNTRSIKRSSSSSSRSSSVSRSRGSSSNKSSGSSGKKRSRGGN